MAAALFAGIAVGVGAWTFLYAQGWSYLTDDPAACANCHIMHPQYDGWLKASHRNVATCNDCHTPDPLLRKYLSKASNGFWHSYGFTTGDFHEPIRIKAHNREVTEGQCRACHSAIVHAMDAPAQPEPAACLSCHRGVGHF